MSHQNPRGCVVVTGASRGIGLSISGRLIEAGYRVIGLARDENRLAEASRTLGSGFTPVQGDVADGVEAALEKVSNLGGSLVGLVNNVGISQLGSSAELPREEFARVLDINVTSVFAASVLAHRQFTQQGTPGSIVNITSIEAFVGHAKMAAYVASKFAVRGLTQALALEWARDGVRVNSVAPGLIDTDMTSHVTPGSKAYDVLVGRTPMRRFGDPIEIAGAVAFLIGSESTFMTGSHVNVDGGYTA